MSERNKNDKEPNYALRRLVAGAALLATVTTGAAAGHNALAKPSGSEIIHQETMSYTIKPGDTLWGIAEELDPDRTKDPREIVDDILELNPNVKAGQLDPGSTIELPKN